MLKVAMDASNPIETDHGDKINVVPNSVPDVELK